MAKSKTLKKQPMRPITADLPIPLWEFVAMIATIIGMTAMGIDIMLPALDDIASDFNRGGGNDQQMIMIAYIVGFGIPQLFYGPLSDRFGRRGLLKICLVGYIATSFACIAAGTFELILLVRLIQGVFASGLRVVASAIVRDLTAGRGMARIMSLIMTVFMAIPIIAPLLGAVIVIALPWQWIFVVLGLSGILTLIWVHLRLPETLPTERRKPLLVPNILRAYKGVITDRITFGYMMAGGFVFGALFSFITACEQIFTDTFKLGNGFVIWFSGIAATLILANLTNARLVERLGMRLISHIALLTFIGLTVTSLVLMTIFGEHLIIFYPLFAVTFACFGMVGANFSAIAMESQGENTGTATAAYGFTTTAISGVLGAFVANLFNGSVIPFLGGFLCLGLTALACVLITERGKLFSRED